MKILAKLIVAFVYLACVNITLAMDMAITVDDLPMHGDLPPHMTRLDVANTMFVYVKKTPYSTCVWVNEWQ